MTRRHACLVLIAALVLATGPRAQAAPSKPTSEPLEPDLAPPRVEAHVLGPNPAYVGQLVELEVQLLRDASTPDPAAPFFPELHLAGAIAILSSSAPPPEVRHEAGRDFLVQKRLYLIFPQTEGVIQVPSVVVSIPGPVAQPLLAASPAVELRADIPRGAGDQLPLVAREVKLERSIDGDLAHLRVGESFSVSLRLSASATHPTLLPRMAPPAVPGLSHYEGESKSEASADRGEYHALLERTTTYVVRQIGSYELPAARVRWLDPGTGRYAWASVPTLSFRAHPNLDLGLGCIGGPRAVAAFGGWFLAVLVLVALVAGGARRVLRAQAARRLVQRSAGERAAFLALERAAREERPGAALSALYRWLRFVPPAAATLAEFRGHHDDPKLGGASAALEERVATGEGAGTPREVVRSVAHFRHVLGRRRAHSSLGPLNRP